MNSAEAATRHARALADGRHLTWFITVSDEENPGCAVARATMADPAGGQRLPGKLVASTIEAVRAMLPAGLSCREQTSAMPAGSIEAWD